MTRHLFLDTFIKGLGSLIVLSAIMLQPIDVAAQSKGRKRRTQPKKIEIKVVEDKKVNQEPVREAPALDTLTTDKTVVTSVDIQKLATEVSLADIEEYLLRYELKTAEQLIEEYIKRYFPDRSRITPEASLLENRIRRALRMLENVERVELLDSIRAPRALIRPGYSLEVNDSWALQKVVSIVNGFVDKRGANRLRTASQQGGRDIVWESRVGEEWMPHQVQHILSNTAVLEANPVLAEDGYTIVYATADSISLGGYDLFSRRYVFDKNTIYDPVPLGYPFNSPYNDYALLYDEELDKGVLISDRFCPEDSVVVYTFRGRPSALGGKTGAPVVLEDNKDAIAQLSLSGLTFSGAREAVVVPLESFYFPLKAGVVCRTWRDFSSNQALESYRKARQLEVSLSNKKEELKKLRAQAYKTKDSGAISKLPILIKELSSLQEDYDRALLEAKNFEIKQRKL